MSSRVAVCGRVGSELVCGVDQHPRFGITGRLSSSIFDKRFTLGGDAYRIALGLQKLSASVQLFGAIGDDPLGAEVKSSLSNTTIQYDCLAQKQDCSTDQMLYMIDKNGIINSYIYDLLSIKSEEELLLDPLKEEGGQFDCVILSPVDASIRSVVFDAMEKNTLPFLWNLYGHVCDLDPDHLLRYVQRVQYLVITPHEARYLCNILGLASIDLLLKEGPRVIVVIEYESLQGSYVYNVFTSERLENQQFASVSGYDASRYRDVMLGFIIGFSYASSEVDGELETMIRIGISCSEQYLMHTDDSSYPLRYSEIVRQLTIRSA